jgi:hypothetical protein
MQYFNYECKKSKTGVYRLCHTTRGLTDIKVDRTGNKQAGTSCYLERTSHLTENTNKRWVQAVLWIEPATWPGIQTEDRYKLFFESNLSLDRKQRHIGRYKLFFGSNLLLDRKHKQIGWYKLFFGSNLLLDGLQNTRWVQTVLWIELAAWPET